MNYFFLCVCVGWEGVGGGWGGVAGGGQCLFAFPLHLFGLCL